MGLGPFRVGLCSNLSSFIPIIYKNWSFLPHLILETKIAHQNASNPIAVARADVSSTTSVNNQAKLYCFFCKRKVPMSTLTSTRWEHTPKN